MIDEFKLVLESITGTLYGFLVLPGNLLLSVLVVHLPGVASWFGVDGEGGNSSQVLIAAVVSWVFLALVCWLVFSLCKNLARIAGAYFFTGLHRASQWLSNLKTALVCKFREHLPARRPDRDSDAPALEFDDLDLVILRTLSALGPAFTLSAPELADQLSLRPAQVQCSLDKLYRARMLDSVIGSTDGFDNYRLTDSGSRFIAMWQQGVVGA